MKASILRKSAVFISFMLGITTAIAAVLLAFEYSVERAHFEREASTLAEWMKVQIRHDEPDRMSENLSALIEEWNQGRNQKSDQFRLDLVSCADCQQKTDWNLIRGELDGIFLVLDGEQRGLRVQRKLLGLSSRILSWNKFIWSSIGGLGIGCSILFLSIFGTTLFRPTGINEQKAFKKLEELQKDREGLVEHLTVLRVDLEKAQERVEKGRSAKFNFNPPEWDRWSEGSDLTLRSLKQLEANCLKLSIENQGALQARLVQMHKLTQKLVRLVEFQKTMQVHLRKNVPDIKTSDDIIEIVPIVRSIDDVISKEIKALRNSA